MHCVKPVTVYLIPITLYNFPLPLFPLVNTILLSVSTSLFVCHFFYILHMTVIIWFMFFSVNDSF